MHQPNIFKILLITSSVFGIVFGAEPPPSSGGGKPTCSIEENCSGDKDDSMHLSGYFNYNEDDVNDANIAAQCMKLMNGGDDEVDAAVKAKCMMKYEQFQAKLMAGKCLKMLMEKKQEAAGGNSGSGGDNNPPPSRKRRAVENSGGDANKDDEDEKKEMFESCTKFVFNKDGADDNMLNQCRQLFMPNGGDAVADDVKEKCMKAVEDIKEKMMPMGDDNWRTKAEQCKKMIEEKKKNDGNDGGNDNSGGNAGENAGGAVRKRRNADMSEAVGEMLECVKLIMSGPPSSSAEDKNNDGGDSGSSSGSSVDCSTIKCASGTTCVNEKGCVKKKYPCSVNVCGGEKHICGLHCTVEVGADDMTSVSVYNKKGEKAMAKFKTDCDVGKSEFIKAMQTDCQMFQMRMMMKNKMMSTMITEMGTKKLELMKNLMMCKKSQNCAASKCNSCQKKMKTRKNKKLRKKNRKLKSKNKNLRIKNRILRNQNKRLKKKLRRQRKNRNKRRRRKSRGRG